MKKVFYYLVFTLIFYSCLELPEISLDYKSFEYTEEGNYPKNSWYELQMVSSINLYMPDEELGFANFFLYCPTDGDFKNYSKESIFYLRSCFECEEAEYEKNDDEKYTHKVPVRFVFTDSGTDIRYDTEKLKQSLESINDCLECKIIYTQLPGKSKYTNSFCIPMEDILSQLK